MSEEVFIDSGAFIAFLIRSDRLHSETARLFAEPPRHWYTSIPVISETYSWFLHRLGEESARVFRALLDNLTGLVILPAEATHLAAVWRKLDRLRGHKLTFVDASSLVWLEEREIGQVWGTDRHLAIEGATVTPGPPIL